jgi:dipeptidyl aminopeptidase/acylaminoacyl peptidase
MAGRPISAAMVARSRVVAEPRWSPDGRHLAWVDAFAARADVVVGAADGSTAPVVVTADSPASPVGAYGGGAFCWCGPDRLAVATADGRLVLVPSAGGPPIELSIAGRASAPAATADGTKIAFVLETDDRCDIAVVPTDASARAVLVSDADYAWDPAWSPDGARLVWHEWDLSGMSWDSSRIVVAHPDGSEAAVVAGGGEISVGQPRFSPDGRSLAFVSDESGWWNVWVVAADGTRGAPVLAEQFEHAEPAWGPGQRSYAWSPDSALLAINRNEGGFGRLVVAARDGGAKTEVSKGWHHGLDWSSAGISCVRSGARTPAAITVVMPDGGERRVVARGPVGGFEAAPLVEPEPVQWAADDGATVFGLLYRPSPTAAPPPVLVDIHGGPSGQATAAWSARCQFFVSRGWAVLAPDYRGSTGHGRAYTQALAGEWGHLDVEDTAAGIRAAAEQGWGDAERVVVMGGSAGGLTVLLLCAQHGDLVRAGVSLYGITDLFALAESTHRFESRYLDRIVGRLPDEADRYRGRSPVTHARSIRVPVLVLQGEDDRAVPPEQAKLVVDAIRAAGGTVEYHSYAGEGHGWSRPETIADSYTRVERFLDYALAREDPKGRGRER